MPIRSPPGCRRGRPRLSATAGIGAQVPGGRKVAFLVGVGEYRHLDSQLGTPPVNDVTAMGKLLQEHGYEVIVLSDKDATKQKIEEQFRLALDGKRKAGDPRNALCKDDRLLFQFSGHGIEAEAADAAGVKKIQPFFCVHDSMMNDPAGSMVAFNSLLERVDNHKVRSMFLVDACRTLKERGLVARSGFSSDRVDLRKGVSILYSCSQAEASLQDALTGHGLFTFAILKSLRGETGLAGEVSWNALVNDVQKEFASGDAKKRLGRRSQTPLSSQGEADYVALLTVKGVVAAKPVPPNLPKNVPPPNMSKKEVVAGEPKAGEERSLEIANGVKMVFCYKFEPGYRYYGYGCRVAIPLD